MHTFSLVSVGFVPGKKDLTSDAIEPLIKVQCSPKMPSVYARARFLLAVNLMIPATCVTCVTQGNTG